MVTSFSARSTKDKEFMKAFKEKCKREGLNLSDIVIKALKEYTSKKEITND